MEGDHAVAVELFTAALDLNKNHWLCRLYRAMANFKIARPELSACDFSLIMSCCPDEDLRSKSREGLYKVQAASEFDSLRSSSRRDPVAAS